MKLKRILFVTLLLAVVVNVQGLQAANIDYLEPKPIQETVKVTKKPVETKGKTTVPLITWGGDVATIYADSYGLFKNEGLEVQLVAENNFPKQVEACLTGKTPYLRGTMGMINAAAQAFKAQGLDLVVIYQMTWSTGGDAMVVRPNVKKPRDLKGKTIALQLYGPHMDYVANIINSAGVSLSQVNFKWLSELTLPTFDTKGKILDPVSAFQESKNIDAIMCIIPDALMLTSGGSGGTGASGSVKGANILLSTKTASRIIADVYAVRSDYFESNKEDVQKFVHGLLKGQEELQDMLKDKTGNQAKYRQLLGKAADLLLGAPQATADVEALLGDCEFVGYNGNQQFFTGEGTVRSFENLTKEIQTSFKQMGLMTASLPLKWAEWDFSDLSKGLKYAKAAPTAKPRFDPKKVAAKVEKQISVEPTTWEEEGTLFVIEINFEPNQSTFPEEKYTEDYRKALSIAQTYGGSLIVIEGHSDPLGIAKARQEGEKAQVISQMEQKAKNLSLDRARAVRQSFIDYCKKRNFSIDESQFVAVGMGIKSPKFDPPKTRDEWAANRRVVFRIKQVEAELSEFVPLK